MVSQDKKSNKSPLMLWCSAHTTLAAEEIPLFLEAGFRVVPLMTDFWTFEYAPSLDSKICPDWKASVGLPSEIVTKLQAISFCRNSGQNEFSDEELQLLEEHVDVVYVSVLPNVAIRLAKAFKGTVMFRPFGHGSLNTYTRIAQHYKADLAELVNCPNYMWAPILSTLQSPEDPRICINANHMGAFVSASRFGNTRWSAARSEDYVVETIPRIEKQLYYMEIYNQYRHDHADLPLKILGGNSAGGGALQDPRILGYLENDQYFATAAKARLSIYHGRSPYHVHYHPIEFMTLGVPVLFHKDSALAAEATHFGLTESQLVDAGMYSSVEQANEMARAALSIPALAESWSQRQRFFIDEVFSRRKVLDQVRWIKSRVLQLRNWPDRISIAQEPSAADCSQDPLRRRSMSRRFVREFKRVLRQAKSVGRSRKSA